MEGSSQYTRQRNIEQETENTQKLTKITTTVGTLPLYPQNQHLDNPYFSIALTDVTAKILDSALDWSLIKKLEQSDDQTDCKHTDTDKHFF